MDAEQLMDVTGAEQVEVEIRQDGKVLWVNVDGVCRLRVCRIKNPIVIEDKRKQFTFSPKAISLFIWLLQNNEEDILQSTRDEKAEAELALTRKLIDDFTSSQAA